MKFNREQFISWLNSHVKQSIMDDAGVALNVFAERGSGFFAVPRLLFPEIDGLGACLTGKSENTSENIVAYFKKVMSNIDDRYAKYAVFITYVFRHGLLHQHTPKKFKYGKNEYGWRFEVGLRIPENINRKKHLTWDDKMLKINMNCFYEDVLKSIDIFIDMISKKQIEFSKVKKAFIEQQKYLSKNIIKKRANKFIKNSDLDFIKTL